MELEELKQYIDDSVLDFQDLAECKEEGEKKELLMSIYANFYDLRKECTSVLTVLRKEYNIKEAEVKSWMKEQDAKDGIEHVSDEEKDEEDLAAVQITQSVPVQPLQAPSGLAESIAQFNINDIAKNNRAAKKSLFKKPVRN